MTSKLSLLTCQWQHKFRNFSYAEFSHHVGEILIRNAIDGEALHNFFNKTFMVYLGISSQQHNNTQKLEASSQTASQHHQESCCTFLEILCFMENLHIENHCYKGNINTITTD
ncbi:hypothetical protein Pelo_14294 [Pelomyxa schiedti]|nr:hypothetical protein Pelo_14294 [Pelomyxa schiedti]